MSFKDLALNLGGGRRLVLAGMERGWIWCLAGVAAVVLVLVLYRYERKLVSRRTGLTLLGLRVVAALALMAALFEPIAERTFRDAIRGRVILGVDLSDSMAIADPGRTSENCDLLRKTLALSPAESPEQLPRRDVVRRLLQRPWLKKLEADHTLELFGFAKQTAAATPETLAGLLHRPSQPGDLSGSITDWEPVLAEALKDQAGAPTLGVVLLSDGRRNAPAVANPALERLKERGIPVYSVLIGATTLPRDVTIATVKAPETIDKEQVARIDVVVKADGLPTGAEIPVTLDRPGASPIRKSIRAQPDGGRGVVTFRVPFDAAGEQILTAAVGPVDRDIFPENDRRTIKVIVVEDKAKVLLVDGEARWEFHYLRNALARDPRVSADAIVSHQPPAPGSAGTAFPTALPPLPDSPKQPDPLGAYDAIIVGDTTLEEVSADAWLRLEKYVAVRGGTLVLSPGPRAWSESAPQNETIRSLMPVVDPHVCPVDPAAIDAARPTLPAGVAILPTVSAATGPWPMLQFADERDQSQTVWSRLPRLPWVLASRAKPTATVLITASLVGGAEAEPVVVAAMPYGLGKVLWVGTDGTWRWRYRVGDAYHHRFWGQVAQWATRGKLTAGNRLVQFGPIPPRVPEGDSALIRARFAEDVANVSPDLLIAARIYKAKLKTDRRSVSGSADPVAVVPLRPKADQPRVFDAPAPLLPPGAYTVRLDIPQLADVMKAEGISKDPEANLEVVSRESSELVELAAARDPLEQLASSTGGKVLTDVETDALPELLRKRSVVKVRVEPTRLWERPEALILFFIILSIEWVVRKRAGLP
jgi:hypothetical protein